MAARPQGEIVARAPASASARAAALPGSTRQPVRSLGGVCGGASTVSGTAPRSETTTGVPMAWASTATRPKASGSVEGTVTTAAASRAAGMSEQWPTRRTRPSRPALAMSWSSSFT